MITLGLCIPSRKKSRIRLPERIEELCLQADIKIIEINIDESLDEQGPFDVLLHKIVDYFNVFCHEEAQKKITKLMAYAAKNQDMIVIDDFALCLKIVKRKNIIDILEDCNFMIDNIKVFSPKTVYFAESTQSRDAIKVIESHKIKFPILAKPSFACLEKDSHEMALVFNRNGISDIKFPCILQEFCNHGGVYYKVFVIGTNYKVCENPSIKDLDMNVMFNHETIKFNARHISKIGRPYQPFLHGRDPNLRTWMTSDDKPNMLNEIVVRKIIEKLKETTKCSLFKFDVIIENISGNYALIDFNQFPSYDGITEEYFPKMFVQHVSDIALCKK